MSHTIKARKLIFKEPLIRGRIVERPNRFIAFVEVNGVIEKCHTPVSGRIGGFTLNGLPCLVSGPYEGRGTTYTVEAIGFEAETSPTFQWVGINQVKCNRIVEHFLKEKALSRVASGANITSVEREKRFNSSRLDFLVASKTFIEVKMPLLKIHAKALDSIPVKEFKKIKGGPSGRLPKQLADIEIAMSEGYEGVLLTCFQYKNTLGTSFESQLRENIEADAALKKAKRAGLKEFVVRFALDEEGITIEEIIPVS